MQATFEIKYPTEKTYWIFWTDKVSKFVYGYTTEREVTETNQPNWWITLSEEEWLLKLKTEFNTVPDENN